MEQIQAIMEAAANTESPVIMPRAVRAATPRMDGSLAADAKTTTDYGYNVRVTREVVEVAHARGVTVEGEIGVLGSLETGIGDKDGSLAADAKTTTDYGYNVRVTREVVAVAHARGVTVEGEIGVLGSLETGIGDKEDGHGAEGSLTREQLLTDPVEAEQFVADTGVDALAVAIGTSHGAYKFSHQPDGEVLAMARIEEIHRRLPNTHLVMHGSSSVPQHLQDLVNAYGGAIRQTWGVPVEEIQRGIRHGVRKINVDTDNRLAMTGAIRKVLHEDAAGFDPRDLLKAARAAMQEVCEARMTAFGQASNATRIPAVSLAQMAERYTS